MLIAIHIAHWIQTGRTVTPVEPSEAMQTLRDGLVNAGFILFVLLILSTLIFGRFFCGWACHVVALQDLCTWILHKLRIRPKPFRSRTLAFVPLLAALYMFVWPVVHRQVIQRAPAPHWEAHLTTDIFWETFPGVVVGGLTFLVCGFLIVYMLGNKGFCFYACPYGGFFSVADRFAPGKIRVTDACEGCGHCTATCTSNVRVHEEVKRFGMVVDTGCMKCLDCIDVCPNDALYFGWGRPGLVKGQARAAARRREYDFTWPEELALIAFFLLTFMALRGPFGEASLYEGVPLLFSLGISAISAFLLMQVLKLARNRNWRMHRWQLRRDRGLTLSGGVFLGLMGVWVLFLGHSGVVQYYNLRGSRGFERWLAATGAHNADSAQAEALARETLEPLTAGRRIGLVAVPVQEARIGALHKFLGEQSPAEQRLRRAIELAPNYSYARQQLAELLWQRGDRGAAFEHMKRALHDKPDLDGACTALFKMAQLLNRVPDALTAIDAALQRRPKNAEGRLALAQCYASLGRIGEAQQQAQRIAQDFPDNPLGHFTLGVALLDQQKPAEALAPLKRAVELAPQGLEARIYLAQTASQLGQHELAIANAEAARKLAPLSPDVGSEWALAHAAAGRLPAKLAEFEHVSPDDLPGRMALACLYYVAGDQQKAQQIRSDVEQRLAARNSGR